MWGDAFLFAPKIRRALYKMSKQFFPRTDDDSDKWWSVDVYLPSKNMTEFDTLWYQYNNKQKILPDDLR